jgi:hypothetical protein
MVSFKNGSRSEASGAEEEAFWARLPTDPRMAIANNEQIVDQNDEVVPTRRIRDDIGPDTFPWMIIIGFGNSGGA